MARGSTSARGYGNQHQQERARWKPLVSQGGVACARCGHPIQPGEPWDLGHDDHDRRIYRGPEHRSCNRATRGRPKTAPIGYDPDRRVVLVCGPPGAGKTTYAHTLGLPVYDLDDPQWQGSAKAFSQALAILGQTPGAQAVVIRAGATRSARANAAALVGATETKVITLDQAECIRRVIQRGRPRPSLNRQVAAVARWWRDYQPDEAGVVVRWPV